MKVNKFSYESTAEIKNKFADIIHFQGCTRNCCFCFNPELKSFKGYNYDITPTEVLEKLGGTLSEYVVLTGGEPLEQAISELYTLIKEIKKMGKKVLLETSRYNKQAFKDVDFVLYSVKTFDIDEEILNNIKDMNNVIPVIITDHDCFDYKGYIKACKILNRIWLRPKDDTPYSKSYINLYKISKKYNTKVKRFDTKICLLKKNLKKK